MSGPFKEATFSSSVTLAPRTATGIHTRLAKTKGKIYGRDGAAAIMVLNPSTQQSRMAKEEKNFQENVHD